MNSISLLHRYLSGESTPEEVAELDRLLASDPALRRKLVIEARTDAGLRGIALERAAEQRPAAPKRARFIQRLREPLAWAALLAVMALLGWSQFTKPAVIATLESSENAAWESSLPTVPGASLTKGELKLVSGLATVRFRSGVQMVLEAPAHVALETPMKVRLLAGAAVVDVPHNAIGFIVEAPGAYAVDHGTQFAVSVNAAAGAAQFEVLKGEISVHDRATGKEVRLKDQQGASVTGSGLTTFEGLVQEPELADEVQRVRIGTSGRSDYVNRRNKRGRHIIPELLIVKGTESLNWDMRAFFTIDFAPVHLADVKSVRLRLNQVPSGQGLASRLPLMNTFAVYGVTRPDKEQWRSDPTWEEAPDTDDGVLLGRFDIPRSQQTGSFGIENEALLNFLQADPDKRVTFVVIRETGLIDGEGKGLVHAFASDRHPEASGPLLEFSMK